MERVAVSRYSFILSLFLSSSIQCITHHNCQSGFCFAVPLMFFLMTSHLTYYYKGTTKENVSVINQKKVNFGSLHYGILSGALSKQSCFMCHRGPSQCLSHEFDVLLLRQTPAALLVAALFDSLAGGIPPIRAKHPPFIYSS